MTTITTEPIGTDWTHDHHDQQLLSAAEPVSARDVNSLLAQVEVASIGTALVPHLAAAAAELALVSGVGWRFNSDDAPVAMLRMIAKIAIKNPTAGGPHTTRLHELLQRQGA